jgi:hypothetical protein
MASLHVPRLNEEVDPVLLFTSRFIKWNAMSTARTFTIAAFLAILTSFTPAAGQDPSDRESIQQLIHQLGSESPAQRDQAQARLLELGDVVCDALRTIPVSEDIEVRTRAKFILACIEEVRAERELVKDQRAEKLRLVSLKAKDMPLGDALKALQKLRYVPFATDKIDLSRSVTLDVQDLPIRRMLSEMGLRISRSDDSTWVLEERPKNQGAVHLDGVTFRFERRPWKVEESVQGHLFATSVDQDFRGYLFWSIARISSGEPVAFETCDVHSPKLVYVPQSDLPEARVQIEGTRWWFYDTTLVFENPKEGESKRVGQYEIEIRWPKIYVRCNEGIPYMVLYGSLVDDDITLRTKVFKYFTGGSATLRIRGREPPPGEGPPTWCGCLGAPTRWKREVPLAEEHYVYPETEHGHSASEYKLDEIEKIEIRFHKPVKETFRVSSPILR